MASKPPTSGGFYSYKKNIRTVDEDKDNDIETHTPLLVGREKIKPAAGNYRQFFRSQLALDEGKAELNIDENDSVYNDYDGDNDIEYKHFDKQKVAPALVSSFSAVIPSTRIKSLDVKRVESQTNFALQRQKFETLSDYQVWIQSQVDPFIADLRRAILNERPTDIPEYIMAYALSMNSMAPPPATKEGRGSSSQDDRIIYAKVPGEEKN